MRMWLCQKDHVNGCTKTPKCICPGLQNVLVSNSKMYLCQIEKCISLKLQEVFSPMRVVCSESVTVVEGLCKRLHQNPTACQQIRFESRYKVGHILTLRKRYSSSSYYSSYSSVTFFTPPTNSSFSSYSSVTFLPKNPQNPKNPENPRKSQNPRKSPKSPKSQKS